jgi:hypothetical protein
MKVLIEKYRGFDIYFEVNDELFSVETDSYGKGSKSFAAVKSGIDEYLKNNIEFKPFKAINIDNGEVIHIIGIRKDERFNYEDSKGKKHQLSDYFEKNYVVYNSEIHDQHFATLAYLKVLKDEAVKAVSDCIDSITGDTIKQIKANYIVK